jgi:hypothetical protein
MLFLRFSFGFASSQKRGDMFGPTHLCDFFSAWRTADKQLDWVMHPGDPNQVDAELIMYLLAMYTAAIQSLDLLLRIFDKEELKFDDKYLNCLLLFKLFLNIIFFFSVYSSVSILSDKI